jgi:asparagine synthetase B (glutamine-hydrolysing)
MCGLAAIYSYSGRTNDPVDLAPMTHSLAHRGPDDFGFGFSGAALNINWRDQNPAPIQDRGIAMGHLKLIKVASTNLSTR